MASHAIYIYRNNQCSAKIKLHIYGVNCFPWFWHAVASNKHLTFIRFNISIYCSFLCSCRKKSTSTFAHIIGATHVFLPLRNLESLSPNAIPYTVNWTNNVSSNCCLLFKWIAKKKYFESSTKIDELFLVIGTQIESFVLKKWRESECIPNILFKLTEIFLASYILFLTWNSRI